MLVVVIVTHGVTQAGGELDERERVGPTGLKKLKSRRTMNLPEGVSPVEVAAGAPYGRQRDGAQVRGVREVEVDADRRR